MAIIQLEGMQFHSKIGIYEFEKVTGGMFSVDVEMEIDISVSSKTDSLHDTINYETVYSVVKSVMENRYNLLEKVCHEIANQLLAKFPLIQHCKIAVHKYNPPVGGFTKKVSVIENFYRN
ncbi:MAG: dihydroneopterin aldolase [Bacteroidia bacterium]|nr:dihydroneopterin aldolase [Bacteroidia bacterium]